MTLTEIQDVVTTFLVEDLEIDPEIIKGDARLKEDLGIDSLEVVDVAVLVEREFGLKMRPEDFKVLHTLDDFCNHILEHRG